MPARSLLALLLLLLCHHCLQAQPLAAYTNLQNQTMVWDRGIIRKVDYLPPVELKTGRTTIPYLDNSRSFKIYYKGGVRTVNSGFTNAFYTSDNLVAFLNAKSLNVFDQGTVKNLSLRAEGFFLGDSVLLYLDGVRYEYKAYYNGNIYPIESFLGGSALDTVMASDNVVKVSDNVAAYVNYANQFHIFYLGENIKQEEYLINGFGVGRNTVAYVDANRQFRIFHSGNTIKAEDYAPQQFTVGDNLVSYMSADGYFKIFYNDSVYKVGFFNPANVIVQDNIVAYTDAAGYFKVFYKGEIISLETYFPSAIQVKYNSVAYLNNSNVLRMFTEGELYDVTSADVAAWTLHYDVLQYQVGQNLYKFFYKGREY